MSSRAQHCADCRRELGEPFESIRQLYRPGRIRLLLVGESPPASGAFFYLGNSPMTSYTARAFDRAIGHDSSPHDFLPAFERSGCYLEDLCHEPVDKLTHAERRRAHLAGVDALALRLRQLKPAAIAIALKRIEVPVRTAIERAGVKCPVYVLPFAGYGHQTEYVRQLARLIRRYVVPARSSRRGKARRRR